MSREERTHVVLGCGLRTQNESNSATEGVACANSTATVTREIIENHRLAKKIREARKSWAAQLRAQPGSRKDTTFASIPPVSGCASGDDHRYLVPIESWYPSTPEERTEERRRVMEESPRYWWWKPRYRLVALMRDGLDQDVAEEMVRAEYGDQP